MVQIIQSYILTFVQEAWNDFWLDVISNSWDGIREAAEVG